MQGNNQRGRRRRANEIQKPTEQDVRTTALHQSSGHPAWYAAVSSGLEQTFRTKAQKSQEKCCVTPLRTLPAPGSPQHRNSCSQGLRLQLSWPSGTSSPLNLMAARPPRAAGPHPTWPRSLSAHQQGGQGMGDFLRGKMTELTTFSTKKFLFHRPK